MKPHTPAPRSQAVRRALLATALVASLGAPLLPAAAHAEYPDKPVKIVVGFGAGTGSDIQGRVVADALARELKVPVIVENRPGAAGMLAASSVAGAEPDGYTLVFGTTTLIVTLPILNANAKYDSVRDFTPIGTMGKSPFVVVVPNKPGAPTSLKDLLASMKTQTLSFGSIGNGSFGHLASARLMQSAGVTAVHVPYKSSPQELQDLAAGNLAFATDSTVATLPLIRNGLLRPLAVTSTTRVPTLPDVPTVAEVIGTPFEHTVWTGLLAPKGTPPAVVQKLSTALKAALESKELKERFNTMQLIPFNIDAPAFATYIASEVPAWRSFLQKSGIRIDQ